MKYDSGFKNEECVPILLYTDGDDDDIAGILSLDNEKKGIDGLDNVVVSPKSAIYDLGKSVKVTAPIKKELLTFRQKAKFSALMLFIVVYLVFLIRGFINEQRRIQDINKMIQKMKPILASLYEMDRNLAKGVDDLVNSYQKGKNRMYDYYN